MSYLASDRASIDVSIHPFTGFSSPNYTYGTPTSIGAGVTRPDSTSFTLAAGRSYVLIGSINFQNGSSSGNWIEIDNRFTVDSVEDGTLAKIRLARSGYLLDRNPTYRKEAVIFIPSSAISTSVTIKLKQVATDTDNTFSPTYSATTDPAAIIIMSVAD